MSNISFLVCPPSVGRWQIGGPTGMSIHLAKRPRWLTRLMCAWLLQWVWVDRP
jgi:hypothetical protein